MTAADRRTIMIGADFEIDTETGVLLPPDGIPDVPYVDGSEAYVREVFELVSDRGPYSGELEAYIHDWATRYHLSASRWALLDGLDIWRHGRVLELGCGCGAVTTWLSESAGHVDAVEGSAERAAVTRARCAGRDNVRVLCADVARLEPAPDYDVVTLIGVLEYASAMGATAVHRPRDAAVALLRRARGWLRDGGRLVLAIENRLGLKYLGGHPEDHVGEAFAGVEGYKRSGTPVTFSRSELLKMLDEAGYGGSQLFLPFPDYKVPQTILNAAHLDPSLRLTQWIGTPFPDPVRGGLPGAFNEALALREVEKAGLLADLANSFLVVAEREDSEGGADAPEWIVRHYALSRQPAFRQRKTLVPDEGHLVVRVEPVGPLREPPVSFRNLGYRHSAADSAFVHGPLVAFDVLRGRGAETANDQVVEVLRAHAAWLVDTFGIDDGRGLGGKLSGAAFDAHPLNVVREEETGVVVPIDLEWEPMREVTLGYALWRSAYVLIARWGAYLGGETAPQPAEWAGQLAAAALDVDAAHIGWVEFEAQERLLQTSVSGIAASGADIGRRLHLVIDEQRALVETLMREREKVRELADHAVRERERLLAEKVGRDEWAARAEEAQRDLEALRNTRVMRLARRWWSFTSRLKGH